tara:strand:- start:527 stop:3064 length:2538 start_codon:yes stop_codon:yes gene_type:complete
MVSNEVWTGTGQSVTMAPESELFLGYMPYGPTLGRTGTNRSHLIKYSLGYGLDGTGITLSNMHGEGTPDNAHFTDYYHLVPDLYTGCTAKFYSTTASGTAATLEFTARVAANDADAIYFSGNLADFPVLHAIADEAVGDTFAFTDTSNKTIKRGYIVLEANGAIIPAPISLENRATVSSYSAGSETITFSAGNTGVSSIKVGDVIYEAGGGLVGKVWTFTDGAGAVATQTEVSSSSTLIHFISSDIGRADGLPALTSSSSGILEVNVDDGSADKSVSGIFTAGDPISYNATDSESAARLMGYIVSINSAGDELLVSSVVPDDFTDATCDTVNGDATITMDSTASLEVGMQVSGNGIPTGATVASITDATTFELSATATADATDETLTFSVSVQDDDYLYWGRDMVSASSDTTIHTVSPRILSNHWLGLTNSITTPTTEVEMRQMNLSLGGTRNFSYQYRGMETAGQASLDVNLNHGAWLYYAFGTLSSLSATRESEHTHTNSFETERGSQDHHELYAGVGTGTDNDRESDSHSTLNGKFHRVLKGSQALCPPLLPNTSAFLVTDPSNNDDTGALQNGITYTLAENNSAKLPSFAMELLVQKPSVLAGSSQSLMVDRNTYNESVYAQIYPGLVVSDMTLSANENEELKGSINLNAKTVIEAPDGYVGKCYDATNNDTTEFKNLLNFGQQTGSNTQCEQAFLDPFFFSNGSISLFGQEFLKVSSFTLNIQNNVQDKRYVGQYNNRIKDYITGQRTYEVTIQALVTDRRIFDELRKLSPNRVALGDALIDLEFTKSNGESITLSFDDYMISTATWPIQDDRGPIQVDFTIMPLRVNTLSTTTHWVIQS